MNDGDSIDEFEASSLFFRPTQDHFSDPLDPTTFAGFDVQGSIGPGGTLGSVYDLDSGRCQDPPVAHPSQVDTQEETTVAIDGIVLTDLDVPTGDLEMTLEVSHGTLTLGSTTGRSLIIRDTLSALNAALATLTYTPDPNYFSSPVNGFEAAAYPR